MFVSITIIMKEDIMNLRGMGYMRGVGRRRRMGGNDINTINTHVGNSPKINLKIKKDK